MRRSRDDEVDGRRIEGLDASSAVEQAMVRVAAIRDARRQELGKAHFVVDDEDGRRHSAASSPAASGATARGSGSPARLRRAAS